MQHENFQGANMDKVCLYEFYHWATYTQLTSTLVEGHTLNKRAHVMYKVHFYL